MGRLLGIDFGEVRIGVSVTDERKCLVLPVGTFRAGKTLPETAALLVKELARYGKPEKVVVGLPLLLNGKEGEMAVRVREFGNHLQAAFETEVVYWDERLTSMQVEKLMIAAGQKRKKRAEHADALAATTILQTYLDSL